MVSVWKVYAMATCALSTAPPFSTGASFWRMVSSAKAVPLSIPASCELPCASTVGCVNWTIFATVPGTSALPVLSCTPSVTTTA